MNQWMHTCLWLMLFYVFTMFNAVSCHTWRKRASVAKWKNIIRQHPAELLCRKLSVFLFKFQVLLLPKSKEKLKKPQVNIAQLSLPPDAPPTNQLPTTPTTTVSSFPLKPFTVYQFLTILHQVHLHASLDQARATLQDLLQPINHYPSNNNNVLISPHTNHGVPVSHHLTPGPVSGHPGPSKNNTSRCPATNQLPTPPTTSMSSFFLTPAMV